jgi:trans-aconitate 2-methyltransferase
MLTHPKVPRNHLYLTCICFIVLGMTWDPLIYNRFADERGRPFFELVDRIPTENVRYVTDLGCGPGNLTVTLAQRWPGAAVLGVDNDSAMVAAAEAHADTKTSFIQADVATWTPSQPLDVLVANAAFQWVPGHRELMATWMNMLTPGGSLAFQVPGNLDDPHHQAIRALRSSAKWRGVARLAGLPARTHDSFRAIDYLETLAPISNSVDTWETTYVHILPGTDPILDWVKGTALRPVLAALDSDEQRNDFCSDLAPALQDAYPRSSWGTPFPFRRVFVVAVR